MKQRLICESGSTKSDWVLIEDGIEIFSFQSQGYNPYTQTKDYIQNSLKNEVYVKFSHLLLEDYSIHFYGAGCGSKANIALMINIFNEIFIKAKKIEIFHDMLGACHGFSQGKESIIGILGTGSNACFFDGKNITRQRISLGYVLGDEGSGNHIGKILLKKILYEEFDKQTIQHFYNKMNVNSSEIIDILYKKSNPNRFLASFAIYLPELHQSYRKEILDEVFGAYINVHIIPLMKNINVRIGMVGSIAYHFKNELLEKFALLGIKDIEIQLSPLEGLINYYKNFEI